MTFFPEGMIPPPVTMDTVGFWEAAREHRLVLQRCDDCNGFQHPPSPVCHRCRSNNVAWRDVEGRGTVYTYTAVHKAFIPALAESLPYFVAVIELPGADGTRIVSNLVEVVPKDVTIGMDVEVVWDDYPELSVPRFRPA
jgi:uncharacterized protein